VRDDRGAWLQERAAGGFIKRMAADRVHADAMHGQRARTDLHAWFTQAPVVPGEAGEAAGLRIDGDDRDRQFDDLIVAAGAGGFGVQECDLYGGWGLMLGLLPCRVGR
jgi:hypothetical protein